MVKGMMASPSEWAFNVTCRFISCIVLSWSLTVTFTFTCFVVAALDNFTVATMWACFSVTDF